MTEATYFHLCPDQLAPLGVHLLAHGICQRNYLVRQCQSLGPVTITIITMISWSNSEGLSVGNKQLDPTARSADAHFRQMSAKMEADEVISGKSKHRRPKAGQPIGVNTWLLFTHCRAGYEAHSL